MICNRCRLSFLIYAKNLIYFFISVVIYKSLTDTWMWKLGLRLRSAQFFFWAYLLRISGIVSLLCAMKKHMTTTVGSFAIHGLSYQTSWRRYTDRSRGTYERFWWDRSPNFSILYRWFVYYLIIRTKALRIFPLTDISVRILYEYPCCSWQK